MVSTFEIENDTNGITYFRLDVEITDSRRYWGSYSGRSQETVHAHLPFAFIVCLYVDAVCYVANLGERTNDSKTVRMFRRGWGLQILTSKEMILLYPSKLRLVNDLDIK